jgi:hypothetical protein
LVSCVQSVFVGIFLDRDIQEQVMARLATRAEAGSGAATRQVTSEQMIGLGIASLLPAVIWPLVVSALAQMAAVQVSATALAGLSAAIAVFLLAVCTPLMLRREKA